MKRIDGIILFGLIFISGFLLWPVLGEINSKIINNYDGQLIAWIHVTVINKILSLDPRHFFEAPIFSPYPLTLAFSNLFLPSALMIMPVWLMTHDPIMVVNAATYLAVTLTLIGMYFLIREVTNDRLVAKVMALVYITSGMFTPYFGHIQNAYLIGLILAIFALLKLTKSWQSKWLWLWGAALVVQTANDFMTGVMLIVASLIILIYSPVLRQRLITHQKQTLTVGVMAGLMVLTLTIPYFKASSYYHSYRPISDVMHFSISLNDLWGKYASELLWLTVGIGMISVYKYGKKTGLGLWLTITLTGFILALGPALKWFGESIKIPWHIPLPYALLYYAVPGFKGFRAPDRFLVLTALGLTLTAAVGIAAIPKKYRRVVLMIIFGLWLITMPRLSPGETIRAGDYPPVYTWLKNQPGEVIIELPIFRWGSDEFSRNETTRMLYQTNHQKTLVNGYSGYSPPFWENMVARIQANFPSEDLLHELQSNGVDYIILHVDEYERWQGKTKTLAIIQYMSEAGYTPVYEDPATVVFKLNKE